MKEKEKTLDPKKDSNEIFSAKYKEMGFTTRAVHVGQQPEPVHGGLCTAIDLSTTHAQTYPGIPFGKYDYSRAGNPTRTSLELQVASLENGKYAQIYSSGMAATSACISLLNIGDEVLCIDDVYGGTQRYFRTISSGQQGIKYDFLELHKLQELKDAMKKAKNLKMIWLESPTNPTLKITNLQEIIGCIKEYNKEIIVVCDNTFMSPFNCNPLDFGVDICLESASKYFGGHSDIIMGTLATNCPKLNEKLYYVAKCMGAVNSPFDCYLMLRALKTLSIRMERINQNALLVAQFLEKHKNIKKVVFAGLTSNPFHKIQKKNLRKGKGVGFGGMIGIYIKGNEKETCKFMTNLKVWTLAESLGAVESLANHPAIMTHASVAPDIRKKLGIDDNYVRLSTGIEDIDDLINDLDQALNNIR